MNSTFYEFIKPVYMNDCRLRKKMGPAGDPLGDSFCVRFILFAKR